MDEPLQLQRPHNRCGAYATRTTMAGLALAASTVPLCLLHDLVGAAAFLASHPLHAAYLLFFARHLAALAAFFCPLLVSTALLLSVLATVGHAKWKQGASCSLGSRTCGIVVAALRAELRPDDTAGLGLVAQLCSFVLGPGDDAAVERVGEIVGELCDITCSSWFPSEEECKELLLLLLLLPSGGVLPFMDDEIDDKVVISEGSSGEQCCQSEPRLQYVKAQEEETVVQDQGLISSEMDKRLECDPVSVEIRRKCQEMELEVKKCEPGQAMQVNKTRQVLRPRSSSIAQRIKLWEEAQVSGNFKTLTTTTTTASTTTEDNMEEDIISVKFSLDSEPKQETCHRNVKPKEFKECVVPFEGMCSPDLEVPQGQDALLQSEEELAEHNNTQEENSLYKDVTTDQSPVRSTSIVGRVHSRTTSENLISEGSSPSPSHNNKEWKRTLACKLYEERMQLKLCRDRAVVEGSDNMDMLWEAYEVAGGSVKLKRSTNKQELVVDEGESEQDDGDDEGSVRQLCCLQALKFSTKKMSFGGGKPSLGKMSKVLKRMAMLSRMGSRRSQKD